MYDDGYYILYHCMMYSLPHCHLQPQLPSLSVCPDHRSPLRASPSLGIRLPLGSRTDASVNISSTSRSLTPEPAFCRRPRVQSLPSSPSTRITTMRSRWQLLLWGRGLPHLPSLCRLMKTVILLIYYQSVCKVVLLST